MYSFADGVGLKEVTQVLKGRREYVAAELKKLDEALVFYGEKSVERTVSKEPQSKAPSKPGPSAAVLAAVKENPGQPLRVVVDSALAKGVATVAKDPKHMLRNTVDVLLKAKKLARLDGKLYPATEVRTLAD